MHTIDNSKEIVIKWHHQLNPASPSTYEVKFITRDIITKDGYGDIPNIKRIIPKTKSYK